ncbi:MAG: tetratricopeptide repeat protein [Candidatus Scalindua sp.]|jgi:tetratricopeptide (TPR) repeat protein|nr:tetratricopeptide repeat protein [Candidatus Scalindua sp.]MBT5306602.1 tetratricopeptide repeat protein [Candidatus Scalindua sp.]MBT6053009.1 tetratricopeptide repeat protein [Candidatus Scalindua sp.]MBT6230280.1 tetratricopeptide repeat protein [Candidatus Scalindua sp.]MBT6564519.1 tetratricopeptide repeat protein [Candidatus Scalindua sp.]
MLKKYIRKIIVHWITISGVALIAVGTLLTYVGKSTSNRFDDKYLHQSIGGKSSQVDKLVKSKSELLVRIDEYQKKLLEKSETIQRLKDHVNKLNVIAAKQPADEQVDVPVDKPDVVTSEQHADKQIKAGIHIVPEENLHDIILRAKSLCVEGKDDDAYKIMESLRQKHPDFGQAYFMLGTIEMYKENYVKGQALLNRAIQLGLPDDDMAWAYHNLGYSLLQKQDFKKAKGFLEKAMEFNPDMEESKKALKFLDDLP